MGHYHQYKDEELMLKYIEGDSMAFETLYYRHKDLVYAYLSKRLFEKNQIEEVFQNTFLKFHKSKEKYNPDFEFLKWLYTITRSEFLDFLKKKKLDTVPLENVNLPLEEVTIDEFQEVDLSHLSLNEQEAIRLRYFSEEEYNEISQALGTTESNARKLVSRGLKKLKMKLAGASDER